MATATSMRDGGTGGKTSAGTGKKIAGGGAGMVPFAERGELRATDVTERE